MRVLCRSGIGLIALALFASGVMAAKNSLPITESPPKHEVKVLLVCQTPTVRAGENIALWLAVENQDSEPLRMDGRMAWPGNVFLWMRSPNSTDWSGAERVRPQLPMTSKEDVVTILPGCFYGRKMIVGPNEEQLSPTFKKLPPGKYTFIVQFYSAGKDQQSFELLSNEVTVDVK